MCDNSNTTMFYLLTGPVAGGKTAFLRRAVAAWRQEGRAVAGFLSERVGTPDETSGYDLVDIGAGAGAPAVPLLRREGPPDAQRVGPFVLLAEGLARAEAIIRGAAQTVPSPSSPTARGAAQTVPSPSSPTARSAPAGALLVVDEFGPLELAGGGFRPALDAAATDANRRILLAVRDSVVVEAVKALGPERVGGVVLVSDPQAGRILDDLLFGGRS